jgi:ribonuclease P protein component
MATRIASLSRRRDFEELSRWGERREGRWVVVRFLSRPGGVRVALAVSKRFGSAVPRNRLRRQLREALRQIELPDGFYLVIPRPGAERSGVASLRDDLTRLTCEWRDPHQKVVDDLGTS